MENFNNYWKHLENTRQIPNELRDIYSVEWDEFSKKMEKEPVFIKSLIEKLFEGDLIIIRNSIPKDLVNKIIDYSIELKNKNKSEFYKILDNCPNFYRVQGDSEKGKYSVEANRTSFYFFRWNNDNIKIYNLLDKHYGYAKVLSGLDFEEFKHNIPSDGMVDRIQVAAYGDKTGYIEAHIHSLEIQRAITNIYLSTKKTEYSKGGVYLIKNNKKFNVEGEIKSGDMSFFYCNIAHGVDKIEVSNEIKNNIPEGYQGRWWIGLYSPMSDVVEKRLTSKKINL